MVWEQVEITEYNNIGGSTWKYILSAARQGSWSWQVGMGMGRNCHAASSAGELGKNCIGGWDHCWSRSGQSLCPCSHVNSSSKPGFLWLTGRQAFMQESQWLLPPSMDCFSPEGVPCRPLLLKEPLGANVRFFEKSRLCLAGEGRIVVGKETWCFIPTSTFI